MEKFLRTPTRAEGPLTDEELASMKKLSEFWIKNAYKTGPLDKEKITGAIHRLYQAARLEKPKVIIVPSPLVMALTYKIAFVWWRRFRKIGSGKLAATWYATRDATWAATRDATRDATEDATGAATRDATRDATLDATGDATWYATRDATGDATWYATWAATLDATEDATGAATRDATKSINTWYKSLCKEFLGDFHEEAFSVSWYDAYQGGNTWAYFLAYAQACREVLGLTGLKCWSKYQAWEDAGIHGGFRVLHPKFCLVSEFPEKISVDSNYQAHCEIGPSHRWRDGFEIYSLHGTRMEPWMVRTPAENLDPKRILAVENAEQRMRLIQKIGVERLLDKLSHKILDRKEDYSLLSIELSPDVWRPFLKMTNPSTGTFHVEGVENGIGTVQDAINWRWPSQKKFKKDWDPVSLT